MLTPFSLFSSLVAILISLARRGNVKLSVDRLVFNDCQKSVGEAGVSTVIVPSTLGSYRNEKNIV